MKKKTKIKSVNTDKCIELLQNLLIIELGREGLSQHEIREIVGVDINRISKIVKHFNPKKRHGKR